MQFVGWGNRMSIQDNILQDLTNTYTSGESISVQRFAKKYSVSEYEVRTLLTQVLNAHHKDISVAEWDREIQDFTYTLKKDMIC